MKIQLILSMMLISALPCLGEFRTWTNSEGQGAELELRSVQEVDGEKVGLFGMKSGRTVRLKMSQLSAEDAKILESWKPTQPSVFGESLDGNLVVIKDGRFQDVKDHPSPKKYYVFYHTASWCPPCRAFTPTLVKWYEANKNENFELVLITHDEEKSAMLAYAKDKKMPWPQLEINKTRSFHKKHKQGVNGIPALVVSDLEGKVLGHYQHNLDALTKMVK